MMLSMNLKHHLAIPELGVAHWSSCYAKSNLILCSGTGRSSELVKLKCQDADGPSSICASRFGALEEPNVCCFSQSRTILNRSRKCSFLCFSGRYSGISTRHFDPHDELHYVSFATPLGCHYRSLRHIVRSDLVRNGIPDVANPVSEFRFWPKARGLCFYMVTAALAICLVAVMLVAHPFVLIFDPYRRSFQHLLARIWSTYTLAPFFRVEFEGLENLPGPSTPAVYVSNHQSFLDIYTLLTLGISFKFISKTSIFLLPVVGWAMLLLGVIPLRRKDTRSQLECLKRCVDLVNRGASVFFFPEGTRSKDGKLGAFKKGAFSVAAKTRVPVVPITICGTGRIMPSGMEGTLNPGSVKVVVHKALAGDDPDVLCREARSLIADTLDRLAMLSEPL
ncbi:hypothetical protein Dimus_010031 [Dionaea muscipula]